MIFELITDLESDYLYVLLVKILKYLKTDIKTKIYSFKKHEINN